MQSRSKDTEVSAQWDAATTFGQVVVWSRQSFRLTQEALAQRACLPQSVVSQVENDQIDTLSPDILGPLTKALLSAAQDLLGTAEPSPRLGDEETRQIVKAHDDLQRFLHSIRAACE